MYRILVSAQSGFIVSYLQRLISNLCPSSDDYWEFFSYRCFDPSTLAFDEYDLLIDIGSPTPLNCSSPSYKHHLRAVTTIYSCVSIRNTLFISSVSEFGKTSGIINEYTKTNPNCAYAEMKTAVKIIHKRHAINCSTHFLSGIAGKGMPETFMKRFVGEVLRDGYSTSIYDYSQLFNGCYRVDSYVEELLNDSLAIAAGQSVCDRIVHSSSPKTWAALTNVVRLASLKYEVPLKFDNTADCPKSIIFKSQTFSPRCTTSETLQYILSSIIPDIQCSNIT